MKSRKLMIAGALAVSLMVSGLNVYAMPADVADDGFEYDYGTEDYNPDASANTAGYYNADNYLQTIDVTMTATATVNMRSSAGGTIVGTLEKGQDIHVIGNQTDVCWYQCELDDGEIVYIYDDYLLPDFPETLTATHIVNVRTGASTAYDIVGTLNIGDTIKASALEDGWIKFTYEKTGQAGYVYAAYVAVQN